MFQIPLKIINNARGILVYLHVFTILILLENSGYFRNKESIKSYSFDFCIFMNYKKMIEQSGFDCKLL